jgi:hypothetical protein
MVDRRDGIYRRRVSLNKIWQDSLSFAEMWLANSADNRQLDIAHGLRAEWVRLEVRYRDDKTEAERDSLKKRMVEFLATVPKLDERRVTTPFCPHLPLSNAPEPKNPDAQPSLR